MKNFKLILRIIISPIVFFLSFITISIFTSIIFIIICPSQIVLKFLGMDIEDSYKDLFWYTFLFITYPIENTKEFIINSRFIE